MGHVQTHQRTAPYSALGPGGVEREEESALSYISLSVGPLGGDITTVVGRLNAGGYFHRVTIGQNPTVDMPRVMLMVRGLRRAKGPTQRKIPTTIEDRMALNGMLDLGQVGQQILWATILLGWFFMLRMSEFLDTGDPLAPEGGARSVFLTSTHTAAET